MQKKQTAVEWLVNKLFEDNYFFCTGGIEDEDLIEYIKKAKLMQKEQIKDAYTDGCIGELYELNAYYTSEKYYNDTYEKNNI
jgi:hypothetical protein